MRTETCSHSPGGSVSSEVALCPVAPSGTAEGVVHMGNPDPGLDWIDAEGTGLHR